MLETSERYPRAKEAIPDFRTAFRQYILPAFAPAAPLFSRSDSIVTQGSCFASNVAKTLRSIGVKATWLEVQEVMNSPLASRTYLEYMLAGRPVENVNNRAAIELVLKPEALADFRHALKTAAGMVFTCGLAYCQFSDAGEFQLIGLKGVPGRWRLTSVNENQAHIEAIIAMVRSINPSIRVILTVSPIPMTRAPGQGSAFTADCASKSVLRAAVQQVMELRLPDVHYWPSFDAIRWLSRHVGPVYGVEGEDHRHPGQSYIDEILSAFVESFFAAPESGPT
jgi:hypothetical protein